jgi:SAM-dependent methyltransferase
MISERNGPLTPRVPLPSPVAPISDGAWISSVTGSGYNALFTSISFAPGDLVLITRRYAAALFAAPLFAQGPQAASGDTEWASFITWLKGTSPEAYRGFQDQLGGYRTTVLAAGTSPADADALIARLTKRMAGGNEADWLALTFDRIYSRGDDRLTRTPNAFLVDTIKGQRPGKALDIGMGEGRNAIYLAQQGWQVTGLDLSEVGVRMANARARELSVTIDARIQDIDKFEMGTAQWDLVCLLYFPIPESLRHLHDRIAKALKPGGNVIIEGLGSAGQVDALLAAWAEWKPTKLSLRVLEFRERTGRGDWGGSGRVSRMLLQKPT